MAKTTVRDIYRASLSILFEEEDNDPDFKRSFPFFLSKLLMEILPYENQVRRFQKREALRPEDVPVITEIDDTTLPYDERFLRTAIPDGIAGLFMADDDSKKRNLSCSTTSMCRRASTFVRQSLRTCTRARRTKTNEAGECSGLFQSVYYHATIPQL